MTPHRDEEEVEEDRSGAAPGRPVSAAEAAAPPLSHRAGLLLSVVAATVVLALATSAVVALRGGSGGGTGSTATTEPSATASFVTPPSAQVRPVHEALHDIDTRCRAKDKSASQTSLTRDVDTIIEFSRRYPDARFPIDDETGTTLSLLLVTSQSMRTCAPALVTRVDGALPPDFRDPAATAS
ncbi:hypothetical protein RFN58_35595 [Streptomyces iakyrus]|uniref:hypothetical protein n=1 Tax=Streptomyces iakyrus TaxID=68219 RepID=UPI000524F1C0|nr:hypothetical protein [Streptomyces iakyrus]